MLILLNDSEITGLTTTAITGASNDSTIQEFTSRLSAIKSEIEFLFFVFEWRVHQQNPARIDQKVGSNSYEDDHVLRYHVCVGCEQ